MVQTYRDRKASPRARAQKLLADAKRRSKDKGLPAPEISAQTIEAAIRSGRCALTKLPFDLGDGPEPRKANPFAPSLDRIDSKKGYTIANTRVIAWAVNRARGTASDAQLVQIALALLAQANNPSSDAFKFSKEQHP